MQEITKGNCRNCPYFSKFKQTNEYVEGVRTISYASAGNFAHCEQSYQNLIAYTEGILDSDMEHLFHPNYAEFYEHVADGTCTGPGRNWKLLGLIKVCNNPAFDS